MKEEPGAAEAEEVAKNSESDSINVEHVKSEGTPSTSDVDVKTEDSQSGTATPGAGDDSSHAHDASSKPETITLIKEDQSSSDGATIRGLREQLEDVGRARVKEQETAKDLKTQLKRAQNDLKEMKLLLDMYKSCPKEQRDKTQIMVSEKKARAELEEARQQLKKQHEAKKEEKKRLADEDAAKRIRHLEEQCSTLQKQVATNKQEEEALLSEMETTGTAFEDMQEQNSR